MQKQSPLAKKTTTRSKLTHHTSKRKLRTSIKKRSLSKPKPLATTTSPTFQQSSLYQTQLTDEKAQLNTETGPVRVRFAPSPTGTLHLGGLRTALYNLLFVKNRGGEMILRIEDTDRTRLVPGAVQSLIDDMRWVGITYDEGPDGVHIKSSSINSNDGDVEKSNQHAKPINAAPYTQSERFHLYQEASQRLLKTGHAYHCFCTPERLDQVREQRAAKGEPIIYDRLCSTLSNDEVEVKKANGETFVVRMKMPDGVTMAKDLVRGEVRFQNNLIDDQVLMKSDGFPTYHLANIVDDHMMNITHVIRGEEWLPSLPKHVQLYKMFGWEAPQFAHLPLLLREDGGKLSKRFRDSSLNYYVEMGYLPESIINFVALLGWHPTVDELQDHVNTKAGIAAASTTPQLASVKGASAAVTTTTTPANGTKLNVDVTKLDPAALKALLTDDKTKLKQKTNQLSQSTVGGGGLNEVFTVDELSKYFNIHNIQKSGATVELNKLKFFHTQHWKRALNEDISRLEAFAAPHVHAFITRFKSNALNEEDLKMFEGVEYHSQLSTDPTITDPEFGLNTKYHKGAVISTINDVNGKLYKPNQSIVTALKTSRDHPYTLLEFPAKSVFVWARPKLTTDNAIELKKTFWINDENKTPKNVLTTPQVLEKLIEHITALPDEQISEYNVAKIVDQFKAFGKNNKVSLKEIYQPLRFAFSGSLAGPGVADQLCAIGKDEAIQRIKAAIQ